MAFLAKTLYRWNESSKNADVRILSNFQAIVFGFFLHIEKFYELLSTCQISDHLDHPSRNYRGGQMLPPLAGHTNLQKPGLFRVKEKSSGHFKDLHKLELFLTNFDVNYLTSLPGEVMNLKTFNAQFITPRNEVRLTSKFVRSFYLLRFLK